MRKLLALFLLFGLLCPGAAAEETPKYVALTIEGFPAGQMGTVLLEELAARKAHATFFLSAETLEADPGLAEALVAGGHEVGMPGPGERDLSRRAIAGEITRFRALIPRTGRVRFLRIPGSRCSDGLRQVAEAMGLSFLDWSLDPKAPSPAGRTLLDRVRGGDVIRLTVTGSADLPAALDLLDALSKRGFTMLTASELAARRQITLRSGYRYREFQGSGR